MNIKTNMNAKNKRINECPKKTNINAKEEIYEY